MSFMMPPCLSDRRTTNVTALSGGCINLCVREYISRFALETEEDICSRFAEEIPGTPYHADLRQVLYLIYLEKYVDAGRRIAVMDQDLFVNKGIGFRAAAMEYCRQRMM